MPRDGSNAESAAAVLIASSLSTPSVRVVVRIECVIAQFNGAAAGQTVFHLHVHIIPRIEGTEPKPHAGIMADQAQLAATAEKTRPMPGAALAM